MNANHAAPGPDEYLSDDGGEVWSLSWYDRPTPPEGTPHGSAGVCVTERWRRHYNTQRPHSSLKYLTPSAFHQAWRAKQAAQ